MNFKSGLVSIITPTYNRPRMLECRGIEVRAQTYQNIEWIVVDDGSDEKNQKLNEQWAKAYADKYIYLEKNSGCVSIPRNIGISHSNGEFIVPADDDVEQFLNKIELLAKALQDSPSSVLAYGNRTSSRNDVETPEIPIPNWNPKQTWGVDNGQIMYRAAAYENLSLIFPTEACDWHVAKHIAQAGGLIYIPEYISCYHWHGGNRTLNPNKKVADPLDYKEYFTDKFQIDWRTFK